MTTVALVGFILFFALKEQITDIYFLLFISLLNAITFLITTIARIEALKHIAVSISYPIIRISTTIVAIFSIIYFKDKLSIYQGIGIILSIIVIFLLARQEKRENNPTDKNFRLGIILSFIALLSSAATTIVSKFAAITVGKLGYIAFSYTYNILFSLGLKNRLQSERENLNNADALLIGFFIGLFNFAGFYTLLKAFSTGPLSIIASINSLSFIIPILLAILIYKEKLTPKRLTGICLALLATLLLKG